MKKTLLFPMICLLAVSAYSQNLNIENAIQETIANIVSTEKVINNKLFDYNNLHHRELKDSVVIVLHLHLADLYLSKGDGTNADDTFQKLTSILNESNPNYVGWILWAASYYLETRQYDQLIDIHTKIADYYKRHEGDSSEDYYRSLFDISNSYYLDGQYDKSIALAYDILNKNLTDFPEIRYKVSLQIVDSYHGLGRYNEAIDLCYTIMNLSLPKKYEEEAIGRLIDSYTQTGDIENAKLWNQKLADSEGKSIRYYDNEAERYMNSMDYVMSWQNSLEALNLRKEIYGDNSPEYARGLLLTVNKSINSPLRDSTIVANLTSTALDILLANGHRDLGYAIQNYNSIGRYFDSEAITEILIEDRLTRRDTLGAMEYVITLANIYRLQHRNLESIELLYGIKIHMENDLFGVPTNIVRYVNCCMGIAQNYMDIGEYAHGETMLNDLLVFLKDNEVNLRELYLKISFTFKLIRK
jgi:uncharacterized protein YebE (UPF0316 family)